MLYTDTPKAGLQPLKINLIASVIANRVDTDTRPWNQAIQFSAIDNHLMAPDDLLCVYTAAPTVYHLAL